MSAPTIHVTRGYAEEAYHPHCPASGAIARAFDTRTFSRRALVALQDLGITVVIDGEPQSYLANNHGPDARKRGEVVRLFHNQSTGE